jgi:hypothetical protein
LFERMSVGGESFWTVVHEPFIARDLTRHDLRVIISRGLERTKGSYKALVETFNLQPQDYKRFLSFLRKHECHMPFQRFRSLPVPLTDDEQGSQGGTAARSHFHERSTGKRHFQEESTARSQFQERSAAKG